MSADDLPALLGGNPIRPEGPPPWPMPDPAIEEAMTKAFRDGTWGRYHGPHVDALAAKLCETFQQANALPVASGTLAMEIALKAAGLEPGDEVVMAAYDYEATFLSIHALGAMPVLIDVQIGNLAPTPNAFADALSPRTKAIIVSHLHGGIADIPAIRKTLVGREIIFIEDVAQCPGGGLEGKPLGSFGDLAILSFGGSKLLTAGRGGAILGSRADLIQRAKALLRRGPQEWGILSELQALVLLPQLHSLESKTRERERAVQRIAGPLQHISNDSANSLPAYYKVGYFLPEHPLARALVPRALRAEGIAFGPGFRPLHRGRSPSRYRAAGPLAQIEQIHGRIVTLHHPVLLAGDSALEQVATAVSKTYLNAERITAAPLPPVPHLRFDD